MKVRPKRIFSRKNAPLLAFLFAALAVAVALAAFVAPWASSKPDGLEKVAKEKGFEGKAKEGKAPAKGYSLPGIKSERSSTSASGLLGVVLTLVVGIGVGLLAFWWGRLLKKKSRKGVPLGEA